MIVENKTVLDGNKVRQDLIDVTKKKQAQSLER